jgi:hypothetical protein
MKYLPLFHPFKAIYQFPKHIIFLVKIVANAPLRICTDDDDFVLLFLLRDLSLFSRDNVNRTYFMYLTVYI